jgi:hypothetical protein
MIKNNSIPYILICHSKYNLVEDASRSCGKSQSIKSQSLNLLSLMYHRQLAHTSVLGSGEWIVLGFRVCRVDVRHSFSNHFPA